jgi:hypothetical protein
LVRVVLEEEVPAIDECFELRASTLLLRFVEVHGEHGKRCRHLRDGWNLGVQAVVVVFDDGVAVEEMVAFVPTHRGSEIDQQKLKEEDAQEAGDCCPAQNPLPIHALTPT